MWAALLDRDPALADPLNPDHGIAIEAARTQDRCDVLAGVCSTEDVMIDNGRGQPVAHPAWVESRQQATNLKQLVAALRLPDEKTGKRPQARPGALAGRAPSTSAKSVRDRLRSVG